MLAPCDLLGKIMRIRTVTVHHVPEKSVADKGGHKQFTSAKAAVFHKHQGGAARLLRTHESPKAFDAVGTAHLKGCRDPRLQRVDRDLHVRFPIRGNVHSVDPLARQKRFVIGGFKGAFSALLLHPVGAFFGAVGVLIAHGNHLNVLHIQQDIFQDRRAAKPKPDHAEGHFFHRALVLSFICCNHYKVFRVKKP